jgi:hypothetical protein
MKAEKEGQRDNVEQQVTTREREGTRGLCSTKFYYQRVNTDFNVIFALPSQNSKTKFNVLRSLNK